jgi:hypothetical protein
MNNTDKKWPGISIHEEDRDIADRIRKQDGIFKGIDQKDLLMIAAAIALKTKVPATEPGSGKRTDTVNPGLINQDSYMEFRQYIALIYYTTIGEHDLSSMSDPKVMIDNFVEYAHRGLQVLSMQYLESSEGDSRLEEMFVEYLGKVNK